MADVTLPQLGETVTEGTITRWFKKVGDSVAADEPLFEVSTDKVDTEVPSPISGTVTEIRVQEGDTVPVGAVIAVVGEAEGAPRLPPNPSPLPRPSPSLRPRPSPNPPLRRQHPLLQNRLRPHRPPRCHQRLPRRPHLLRRKRPRLPRLRPPTLHRTTVCCRPSCVDSSPSTTSTSISSRAPGPADGSRETMSSTTSIRSPRLRRPRPLRLLQHRQPPRLQHRRLLLPLPPAATPTAPAPAPHVTPGERDSTVRLSKIRKLTGSHMVMSKGVSPHAFSVVEVDFANVDITRNKVKSEWKAAEGFGLTYLPFITRAVVEALTEYPHLNASVSDDDLVVHNFIDIGIAVDLDFQGLLVPVVRAAETKRLRAIAQEINDLAGRARSRKLSPDEISGGTFTISNNGSAGSVLTMPIINQPQVAILSTDAIVRKPVVVHAADGGEGIAIHPVGNLAMSWDHRAFDGAYAAGLPRQDQRDARDPRLGCRVVT